MSDDFYAKAVANAPSPSLEGGASGYFSAPSATLDPNLFDGTALRADVRTFIKGTLWHELDVLGLDRPAAWTFIWLAGSGISYQWQADRGNGDLDVLFGVDYTTFLRDNPDWGGMSEGQFATWLNGQLKTDLWPKTASTQFGEQAYEVTFYLNPGTGKDITNIHPYAAYDIRKNTWTVTPPKVATDPTTMYPAAWFKAASGDSRLTGDLVDRYQSAVGHLTVDNATRAPGVFRNAHSALQNTLAQAQSLFEDIHGGRHAAFAEGGHGYGDWHNFRWQRAKQTGVIHALGDILRVRDSANEARDTETYGGPIAGADEALSRAAMVSRTRPGMPQ